MNKVLLIGRLVTNPQMFDSKNLTKYLRVRLAVTKENNREESDFVPLIAFGNTATFISNYFNKGDLVSIEGSLSASNYKNDKQEIVESISVIIQNIRSLEPKNIVEQRKNKNTSEFNYNEHDKLNTTTTKSNGVYKENNPTFKEEDEDDDLPWEIEL
ncbi:MAG: single-stranded DNA-binding protein [Metamycoplasmataceae bacterium]